MLPNKENPELPLNDTGTANYTEENIRTLEGVEHIRLQCPDEKTEGFFAHYGFEKKPEGWMELYIGYGEEA